jgi:hypothetical protein
MPTVTKKTATWKFMVSAKKKFFRIEGQKFVFLISEMEGRRIRNPKNIIVRAKGMNHLIKRPQKDGKELLQLCVWLLYIYYFFQFGLLKVKWIL